MTTLVTPSVTPTHPLSGRRLTPQDRDLDAFVGTVEQCVQSRDGSIALKFTDGHVGLIRLDRKDLVTEAYYPPQAEAVNG